MPKARGYIVSLFLLLILLSGIQGASATRLVSDSEIADDADNARIAAQLTCKGFQEAKNVLRRAYEEHITQRDVAFHLEFVMRSYGADGPLSFPTLVMSGDELVEPHGNALDDTTHQIDPEREPVVMIDMGAKYHGFCSDVTRTFFYDGATSEMHDAYEAVLAAEMAVIEAIAPGVEVRDLDYIVDTVLSEYVSMEGVTGLTYWGHGVGRWVHELPVLWGGSDEILQEGDVLAIEPGLYFDDGWAVRVEDTVLVTGTGYEILSDVPRALDDVTISTLDECVLGNLQVLNYAYGLEASMTFALLSSPYPVESMAFFDGCSWNAMQQLNTTAFSFSYQVDYTHSSRQCLISRANVSGQLWHFSETVCIQAIPSEQMPLDPIINATVYSEPPESPLLWTVSCANASMVRVLFDILDAPLYDQYLIMDSSGRVVMDYRGQHEKFHWSEWVSGNELVIRIAASDSPLFGGVGDFRIRVDTVEAIYGNPVAPTTTPKVIINTTSTNTGTTDQSSTSVSSRLLTGMLAGSVVSAIMILVAYQMFRKKN